MVLQPPYSPDLRYCDFFSLSEIEKSPQGTSFWDIPALLVGVEEPCLALCSFFKEVSMKEMMLNSNFIRINLKKNSIIA